MMVLDGTRDGELEVGAGRFGMICDGTDFFVLLGSSVASHVRIHRPLQREAAQAANGRTT